MTMSAKAESGLAPDITEPGDEIYALAAEIFPICRSMTGDGVRRTLDILSAHLPIERHELASGTPVLDWTVPKEWNIADAYIKDASGRVIVAFSASSLHVVNCSMPVRRRMPFAELRTHIFTLPDTPDLIPYRTSFFKEDWGFCMSHRTLQEMEAKGGEYEVVIQSRLEPGALTWGEFVHHGASEDEVLLSTHICHPSLANDNCSGLALLALLGRALARRTTRYTYRLIFIPATIGSIAWLATNEARVQRIKHGLVISNVGDGGGPTYKRSRRGSAVIDRAMAMVLEGATATARIIDFFPYGYDERQFCSPGFDLPVGLFQRSQFGTYPEYHTSADNLDFIKPQHLGQSYRWLLQVIDVLEKDRTLLNLAPKGEPQLGRRGLYSAFGSGEAAMQHNLAVLWVLNMSDGQNSLLDIAIRARMPFDLIAEAARALEERGLVAPISHSAGAGG